MTNVYRIQQIVSGGELLCAVDQYDRFLLITIYHEYDYQDLLNHYKPLYEGIYLHTKLKNLTNTAELISGNPAPVRFTVEENDNKFHTQLGHYQDTGLFLDHAPARQFIGSESANKSVLNLFAYTGSFSIYAANAGAQQTTTVDLSNTYCQWAMDNFKLNAITSVNYYNNSHNFFKFNLQDKFAHQVVRDNALNFLQRATHARYKYDVIVIDPPSYSHDKKSNFNVQVDHKRLIDLATNLLNPGGFIFFSTNLKTFAIQEFMGLEIQEVTDQTIPESYDPLVPHRAFLIGLQASNY